MPETTFLDGIALGQVTPGPILMTAAFVGYSLAGAWGALIGTVAVFTPSFLMLVTAVPFADRLLASDRFRGALTGALATLGGLLFATVVTLGMTITWSLAKGVLGAFVLVALALGLGVHWVVLAAAAVSLVVF
jgi:chromate transporter